MIDKISDDRLAIEILEAVVARRMANEEVSDEAVLSEYPHLADELAPRLAALRAVEAARLVSEARGPSQEAGTLAGRPIGEFFPDYQVLDEIHRGGQGIVYRARHFETGRLVAIKVVPNVVDTRPHELERINREVHILRALNHPGIVPIHDNGTVAGCAYFVMDNIVGQTLDEYVAGNHGSGRPSDAEIIDLFVQITSTVNAAHLRGIIHRDIKPGNIMVDPDGRAYVLDFGLAKISDDDTRQKASYQTVTHTGQFVGSVPWASPEQANGDVSDIDLRTDVYSLGVMFYQLLTGQFPYNVSGSAREVLDNILNLDPIRPSRVNPSIGRDLETLLLKCLQKDRDRRYQSAGELARDLQRYQRGEPLDARRDSAWYMLSRTLRRHRIAVSVATLFFLLVSASAVTSSVLYKRAMRDRATAEAAQLAEKEARIMAEHEAMKALEVQKSLQNLISWANPTVSRGKNITVREVFDKAALRVGEEFADRPRIQAAIRDTIGSTYMELGDYGAGEEQFRAAHAVLEGAVGAEHELTLFAKGQIGWALRDQGRFREAEALLADLLDVQKRVLGDEARDTFDTQSNLAGILLRLGKHSEAERLFRIKLKYIESSNPENSDAIMRMKSQIAWCLRGRREYDKAEPLFREIVAHHESTLGADHPNTLRGWYNLARLLYAVGKYEDAEKLDRKALDGRRRVLGDDHPSTLVSTAALARLLLNLDKLSEAESLGRTAVAGLSARLGPEHKTTVNARSYLVTILRTRGKFADARKILDPLLAHQTATVGADHSSTLVSRRNLWLVLFGLDQYEEAEVVARELVEYYVGKYGSHGKRTLRAKHDLARVWHRLGDLRKADLLFQHVLAAKIESRGTNDPGTLRSRLNHAMVLKDIGHDSVAATMLKEIVASSLLKEGDPTRMLALRELTGVLLTLERVAEADVYSQQALQTALGKFEAGDFRLAELQANRAAVLFHLNRHNEGRELFATAVSSVRGLFGDDDRRTLDLLQRFNDLESTTSPS